MLLFSRLCLFLIVSVFRWYFFSGVLFCRSICAVAELGGLVVGIVCDRCVRRRSGLMPSETRVFSSNTSLLVWPNLSPRHGAEKTPSLHPPLFSRVAPTPAGWERAAQGVATARAARPHLGNVRFAKFT